jgi:Flp pilus assembly protein TadD
MKINFTALLAALALMFTVSAASAMMTNDDSSSSDTMKEAEALVQDEKYAAASDKLTMALKSDPQNADAWNLLGFSSRMMGIFDDAEKQYTNALKIEPAHKGALNYMGQMYVQTGRLEDARGMLQRLKESCGDCKEYTQLDTAIREGKAGNY